MNIRPFALGGAFFLSGAAALLYQVVWQRLVAFQTGIGIYSVALIVAAFLFGLGIGSHLGGTLSARLSARDALLAFGLVELLVGGFGAASGWFYYDLLYVRFSWLYLPHWRAALLHALTLGAPTTLMGLSLPLLVRASVRDTESASATIARLYGVNVIGAATGALCGPWFLIRYLGIAPALHVAAAANVLAGAIALLALRGASAAREETGPDAPVAAVPGPIAGWALLYGLTGFCALALEIVWFRVFEVAVKPTAYTFGTLLAVYLLGAGAGTIAAGGRRARDPLTAFLLLQCGVFAYAAVAVIALTRFGPEAPGAGWYLPYWNGTSSYNLVGPVHWEPLLLLYVLLPALLFGPATFLMGASYPVLQQAVQDDPRASGRKVGLLQAANIAGCVAGSLVVGLWALTALGSAGTLRLIVLLGALVALVGVRRSPRVFVPAALALVALALLLPGERALWLRFHGADGQDALVEEDATGVAALVPGPARWSLWAGGRLHSNIPYGGLHTTLGAAPALLHPNPEHIAVIGLGSGDTAWGAGCRRDATRRLTVFEIYASEGRLLDRFAGRPDAPPEVAQLLRDPRLDLRIQDGRNALLRSAAVFDVIEMDALWPTAAYAGNLYSYEFFALCAQRLRPHGTMCVWAPSRRVRASFAAAFPNVLSLADDAVLIGSAAPLRVHMRDWMRRLQADDVQEYLGERRAAELLRAVRSAHPMDPEPGGESVLNRDLYPRDEFGMKTVR
jgi:spermidine synthase